MIQKTINNIAFDLGTWPLKPDRPTLFFIHGAGNTRSFWKEQVSALSDCANTVALDLPGHGDSQGQSMHQVDDYALAVEALIDAMQAPRPVPCGLSLGGAIVLQLLLRRKNRYDAGILVNSGARLKVMPSIFELVKNDYGRYVASLPEVTASPKTDPKTLEDVVKQAQACSAEVVYNDFTACNAFDVIGRLQEIVLPVLVLSAADDLLTPSKYGRFLQEQLPQAALVNISDAGHFSPLERPAEVNQAIREFIIKLP